MNSLKGKIALVTGSSRGLGKDMALRLAGYGSDVIVTYRSNQEAAAAVVAEIEKLGQKAVALRIDVGDVGSHAEFAGAVAEKLQSVWGRDSFDFLVNNAGHNVHASIADTTEDIFDGLLNVQFKGVFFLTQQMLPLLSDGGRIVNVSTGLTRFTFPGYAAYASMKGAVEVFTQYLAKELGSRGITANLVAPGAIDTDMNKPALEANPQMEGMIAGMTALGRIGHADDIGGVVAFLCSEDAKWVNAQRIEASGGMNI